MLSNKMILLLLLTSVAVALNQPTPLQSGKNFAIYRQSDLPEKVVKNDLKERREVTVGVGKDLKTIVEFPTEDNIPQDSGGNFGDRLFRTTMKDGYLLGRDTIVNDFYADTDILIYYNKTYPGYWVKDFKTVNFGRVRGYVKQCTINHFTGRVETHILVAAGNEIRIFAESYGQLLDEE